MKKRICTLWVAIMVGIIGITLVGCATGPTDTTPAKPTPAMLRDAGFRPYYADTPEKMAHLKTCPPETLMIQEQPGAKCYAIADPTSNTMYIGDAAAYQRLKTLMVENQRLSERQVKDAMFWNLWGKTKY